MQSAVVTSCYCWLVGGHVNVLYKAFTGAVARGESEGQRRQQFGAGMTMGGWHCTGRLPAATQSSSACSWELQRHRRRLLKQRQQIQTPSSLASSANQSLTGR